MDITPDILQVLNESLDRTRYQNELPNDRELAKHLGVSEKTISFWRNGRLTRGDAALVIVLIKTRRTAPEQVAA